MADQWEANAKEDYLLLIKNSLESLDLFWTLTVIKVANCSLYLFAFEILMFHRGQFLKETYI